MFGQGAANLGKFGFSHVGLLVTFELYYGHRLKK